MIELKITADGPADLQTQIRALLGEGAVAAAAAPTETRAPSRSRAARGNGSAPSDTEAPSAEGATQDSGATTSNSGPTATTAASPSESKVEYADVQKAVASLAAARGREAVVSVFNSFGVDHGTKLTPEQWAPAVEALTAAKEAA